MHVVKLVYKGHSSRELENVPFMSSCPLYSVHYRLKLYVLFTHGKNETVLYTQ